MRKVDIYVYGNIIFKNDAMSRKGGDIISNVSDKQVDISEAVVIKGDMLVKDVNFNKKLVCCSGDLMKRKSELTEMSDNIQQEVQEAAVDAVKYCLEEGDGFMSSYDCFYEGIIWIVNKPILERLRVNEAEKVKTLYSVLSEGLKRCHEDCICDALDLMEGIFDINTQSDESKNNKDQQNRIS